MSERDSVEWVTATAVLGVLDAFARIGPPEGLIQESVAALRGYLRLYLDGNHVKRKSAKEQLEELAHEKKGQLTIEKRCVEQMHAARGRLQLPHMTAQTDWCTAFSAEAAERKAAETLWLYFE